MGKSISCYGLVLGTLSELGFTGDQRLATTDGLIVYYQRKRGILISSIDGIVIIW